MRLAHLLADASTEELERLSLEHAHADESLSRPELLDTIEGVLRSFRFVQEFLVNRQPPTFSIITLLLDAPGFTVPTAEFKDAVLSETSRISAAIDSGEILKRDDQLRVYRRVLYQARSNDMRIDASEAAILAVLRHELDVAQVEHFLIEHQADLREFWQQPGAFTRELHFLRSSGLVFVRDGHTLLPEDVAPVVRQVLGIDMPREAARRLLARLSSSELQQALSDLGAPTSGSKEERIERLVAHMAQPRVILRKVGLETLREICRDIGAVVSGAKPDLIARIVAHVAAGRDFAREPEPPAPPVAEPRRLDEVKFGLLFSRLRGLELGGILSEFDLRRTGTKEVQIRTAWESQRAESTLLACLSNLELEGVLRRLELKPNGSKAERVERLIEHFASRTEGELRTAVTVALNGEEKEDGQ